jgi:hypothetical protein
VPDKDFQLPLGFRVTDGLNDFMREFWIHGDDLQLAPPTVRPNKMYVFPSTASVRDADGREARLKISAESVEPIEFVRAMRNER